MKKKLCITLMAVLAVLFAVSTYAVFSYYVQARQQEKVYNQIAKQVQATSESEADGLGESESAILAELVELYQQNSDLVGWIAIEDTNINYPVVQSVDNPNFYLKHAFDGSYSIYGCPYVQENCDINSSDNCIIYGHHMKNGSMFSDLEKFKSETFWQEHRTIAFHTLTERAEYEIIAVFQTAVYTNSPDAFRYYGFVNAESAEDFAAFVERCKELSLYDTGVTAEYGDKLITLSTCEYSQTNGRLVVVAKKR